jgi:hypothetical protein
MQKNKMEAEQKSAKSFCGKSLKKSYRLIPLLSPVALRETVPLKKELANGVEQNLCINFFS